MTHQVVHIKASPKQLSKLRNGHKVRISPAIEGEGCNLIVHPERYSVILKTFNKGKGTNIQLSPQEIMVNQQNAQHLQGTGIFGKKFDDFVDKTIGSKAKDVIYNTADKFKPLIKEGIDKASEYAPELGATALSGLALASGNPELVPFAAEAGRRLGSHFGRTGADLAKDYLDNPSNAGGPRNAIASSSLMGQVNQNELLNSLNQDLGTNFGKLAQANLGNAVAHMERSRMNLPFLTPQPYALPTIPTTITPQHIIRKSHHRGHRKHREIGSVGKGASMIAGQSHLPPALTSQPFSANFQFQHFLPPAYQKFSKGGGLYA